MTQFGIEAKPVRTRGCVSGPRSVSSSVDGSSPVRFRTARRPFGSFGVDRRKTTGAAFKTALGLREGGIERKVL